MWQNGEYAKSIFCSSLKHSVSVWTVSWPGWYFFMKCHFYLKEWRTKLWLLNLGYLADIFWEIIKVSLSLQKQHFKYLLPVIKCELLSKKKKLEKPYCKRQCSILWDFTDETGNNINKCNYCIMKCINIWKVLHNSEIQFFPKKKTIHDMNKRSIQSSKTDQWLLM